MNLDFFLGAALHTNTKEQDGVSNNKSKTKMKSFKLIEYFKKCDMEKSCKNKIKIMGNEKQKEKYQHYISQKRQDVLKLFNDMQNLLKASMDKIKYEESQYILIEFETQAQVIYQYLKTQIETLINKMNKQNFQILHFLKGFIKNESSLENNSYISVSPTKIDSFENVAHVQIPLKKGAYHTSLNQNKTTLTSRQKLQQHRSQQLKVSHPQVSNQKNQLQHGFSKVTLSTSQRKQYHTSKNLENNNESVKRIEKINYLDHSVLLKGKTKKV